MTTPENSRILIPDKRWTPVLNEVFDPIFANLRGRHSAFVFLVLYDRAWHSNPKQISATLAEIQRWTLLDERTITECIEELESEELILRITDGVLRSRTNPPCWSVPLADFELDQGSWTPIPHFLIRLYCPAFPNAVLLPLLLRYQHMSWNNFCWPSVDTLRKRIKWSATRIDRALRIMGDRNLWEAATIDLPWPLSITPSPTNPRFRRFRVRAVSYSEIQRRGRGERVVIVAKEFRKRFKLPQPYY